MSIDPDTLRGVEHIGVSVCAIVHDGNGNILLMKRGAKARDENGHWDICGGAVEFGESIADALHRELLEELNVVPIETIFLNVYDAHRTHNGKSTHWVALLHAALVDPSKIKNNEPHKIDELGWFKNDTLPEPLHSQFPKALKDAIKHGIIG